MEEYLIIGVITNTHGVKGEIKVVPQTNDINRFDLLNDVFIGSEEEDNVISEYTVQAVRYQQKFVLLNRITSYNVCYTKLLRKHNILCT